jgi:DNA-binding response OmpR family regulator
VGMSAKVLVIEDDVEINELLGEYLALEKLRYLKATTGEAGVHLARTERPDAVILDLMLPDVDGFEVARRLTGCRETFDVPVVILTCMCLEADREKGYRSGALYFMNKPFLPDDLLATVRQAIAWKAALRGGVPAGWVWLGGREASASAKALNQMTADLFAQTNLSDTDMGHIRQAMELLADLARQWGQEHGGVGGRVKVEYRVAEDGVLEWLLSEEVPAMLDATFFKADGTRKGGSGGSVGLLGWGKVLWHRGAEAGNTADGLNGAAAQWKEILALTGAGRLESDLRKRWVRLVRGAKCGGRAAEMGNGDGTPAPDGT